MVYFIRQGRDGPIKIGRVRGGDKDALRRLSELQVSSSQRLWLLATQDIPEGYLHRLFAKERERGEWFQASPRLVEYIRRIRDPQKPELSALNISEEDKANVSPDVDILADAAQAERLRRENSRLRMNAKNLKSEIVRLQGLVRLGTGGDVNTQGYFGWQTIADRIGVCVRTAQRYAQKGGLPVRYIEQGRSTPLLRERDYSDWMSGLLDR